MIPLWKTVLCIMTVPEMKGPEVWPPVSSTENDGGLGAEGEMCEKGDRSLYEVVHRVLGSR